MSGLLLEVLGSGAPEYPLQSDAQPENRICSSLHLLAPWGPISGAMRGQP